jgi:hypothetical protein
MLKAVVAAMVAPDVTIWIVMAIAAIAAGRWSVSVGGSDGDGRFCCGTMTSG